MTEATDSKGYDDDNSHMAARTGDMVQIINGRGEFMFALQTPFTHTLDQPSYNELYLVMVVVKQG